VYGGTAVGGRNRPRVALHRTARPITGCAAQRIGRFGPRVRRSGDRRRQHRIGRLDHQPSSPQRSEEDSPLQACWTKCPHQRVLFHAGAPRRPVGRDSSTPVRMAVRLRSVRFTRMADAIERLDRVMSCDRTLINCG